MAAPAWWEARLGIAGALRLARGDTGGLTCFVATVEGFWGSFRAALICYPMYLLLLGLRTPTPRIEAAGGVRILAVETIAYVISWVAFPLLMLPISRWLDRDRRFLLFMVAYNWSQVPQTTLFVAIGLLGIGGLLPVAAAQFIEFVASVAVLIYEWFIARSALSISSGRAWLVIIADIVLGTLLSRVVELLY